MTYYNTTNVRGIQLDAFRRQADTQDQIVLDVFISAGGRPLSPEQVQDSHPRLRAAPLTSIRRSVSNLTGDGLLIKTNVRRRGRYGRPVYCWALKK